MRGGLTADRGRGRGRPAFYQRSGVFDFDEPGDPIREPHRRNYDRSSSLSEDGPKDKIFDRSLSKGEAGDEMRSRKDSRSLDNWRSSSRSDDKSNWRANREEGGGGGRERNDSWRKDDRDSQEENSRNCPPIRRGYGNHFNDERIPWRVPVRGDESTGRNESGRSEERDSSEESQRNGPVSKRNFSNHFTDERVSWRGSSRNGEESRGRESDFWRKEERDAGDDGNGNRNGVPVRRDYYSRKKSCWGDEEEERVHNLPEWSLDDSSNGEAKLGSFDASGAFREASMDDDLKESSNRGTSKEIRRNECNKSSNNDFSGQSRELLFDFKGEKIDLRSKEKQTSGEVAQAPGKLNILEKNIETSISSSSTSHHRHLSHQNNLEFEDSHFSRKFLPDTDDGFSHLEKAAENMVAQWTAETDQDDKESLLRDKFTLRDSNSYARISKHTTDPNINMIDFMSSQTMSKPLNETNLNDHLDKRNTSVNNLMDARLAAQYLQSNSSQNMRSLLEDDSLSHLEKAAESMVNQWTTEDDRDSRPTEERQASKMTVVPPYHEDALKWFYRDPEGAIQGPFLPVDMYEWFASGYFPSNLLVKRGCDERFSPLGELIKACGGMPFFSDQNSPPVVNVQSHNVNSMNSMNRMVVFPQSSSNSMFS